MSTTLMFFNQLFHFTVELDGSTNKLNSETVLFHTKLYYGDQRKRIHEETEVTYIQGNHASAVSTERRE